jgi:hypothetical protein
MDKYKVRISYTTYAELEIQANSEDEAHEIADDTDLDEYVIADIRGFSINDIIKMEKS